ncbi:hypothetical protein GQ602_000066 [Ophiocordyceps camponoti-floridani]|uniref:ABC transporter domain-containing protein n=1 Tax=Ophiocordyceps camponoti-floridani TaxID=2030778 RepID=A0A8H4QBG9_9HYPO|nr:hypothetical protein GQ602_000066 [Ophiocordyceps camponoti-floridani]
MIPQDGIELPGTVRQNLSLFGIGSENEDMKRARARVGLWKTLDKRGGLSGELSDVGLSGGQKQLFSLARALVSPAAKRKSGIVLLDEPDSSVDKKTEAEMRRIVADEFAAFTTITLSGQVIGSDSVLPVFIRTNEGKKQLKYSGKRFP